MRPHAVVVGAGFGGMATARALARRGSPVTLVDRRNFHLFQPLLYQVATASLEPADVAYPLRGILHRDPGIRVRVGDVVGADLDAKRLRLADGGSLSYDTLVLAAGAVTNDFGIPGVDDHGFGLKSLPEATRLRSHLLTCFEQADVRPELIDEGWLTVVVVGGGPTGVETAGALAELFGRVLAKDYPRLPVERARVVLVEMLDDVLVSFPERLRAYTREALGARGVQLRLGVSVAEVAEDHVVLDDGEKISTKTLLWAAGVRASPLVEALGLPPGPQGRVAVERDLSVRGVDDVWAVGDVAAATDEDGEVLPQLAPVAIQAGKHVADQILARAWGEPTRPFRYVDKGNMATIGRRAAVAQLPMGLRLRGSAAWAAWLVLHLVTLMGFRNRLSVFVNWTYSYLTWDRGARLILERGGVPHDASPPQTPL